MYRNMQELTQQAAQAGGLAKAVLAAEMEQFERSEEEVYALLAARWQVMRAAAEKALDAPQQMLGNLISGQAQKQARYAQSGGYAGAAVNRAMALALSASEVNAAMGRVCAAPTAGGCGVLPAVLMTAAENTGAEEREILDALMVAGGVGAVVVHNATISGAEGGCQAECGTAAAMAAAAAVVLAKGTDEMVLQAVAIALMNCMGLVCDPVAGLVQLPCSFRNASQAANALLSADLALAGQNAVIPADEVIIAMAKVGRSLPEALRETAGGGIAATPTAREVKRRLKLEEIG